MTSQRTPRTLLVIAEDGEGNATLMIERARELGAIVVHLADSGFGRDWTVTIDASSCVPMVLDLAKGASYRLDDSNICVYVRSPHYFEIDRLSEAYDLLTGYLTTIGYHAGTYLHSDSMRTYEASKLANLRLSSGIRVPRTLAGNDAQHLASMGVPAIIKGISGIRTEAVALEDARIRFTRDEIVGGVAQVQERIEGRDLKVVFYRRADGTFVHIAVEPKLRGDEIDWRYSDSMNLTPYTIAHDWSSFGASVYERVACRLFDADFKITPSGELVFLEVNSGASGISEEQMAGSSDGEFSRAMLSDWLAL